MSFQRQMRSIGSWSLKWSALFLLSLNSSAGVVQQTEENLGCQPCSQATSEIWNGGNVLKGTQQSSVHSSFSPSFPRRGMYESSIWGVITTKMLFLFLLSFIQVWFLLCVCEFCSASWMELCYLSSFCEFCSFCAWLLCLRSWIREEGY